MQSTAAETDRGPPCSTSLPRSRPRTNSITRNGPAWASPASNRHENVGVAQLRDRPALALEPGDKRARRARFPRQHFEGDPPFHPLRGGFVDGSHPAGPEPIEKDVVAHT